MTGGGFDADELRRWLGGVIDPVLGPVEIADVCRLKGGYSRQIWSFEACGAAGRRSLVLCADAGPGVVGDSSSLDRVHEAALLRVLHTAGVPVPGVLCAGSADGALGVAYLVMDRVPGTAAVGPFHRDPWYVEHRATLGAQLAHMLAAVHLVEVPDGIFAPAPEPDVAARREAARWRRELDATPEARSATVARALRWLEQHQPRPPVRITIVHGDYRTGNIVHGHDGLGSEGLRAVLDWELAHLGDPLEDLAYAQLVCWRVGTDRVGGLVDLDRWPEIYGEAAGVSVDPASLRWWEVLGSVKMACLTWRAAGTTPSGAERDLLERLYTDIGRELDEHLLAR